MREVCVFTGTRAEYGLLKPLMAEIKSDPDLNLKTMVSGLHLSPEFGLTYQEIENDGFVVHEKIEILLSSDSSLGICKSMGLGLIGFCEALERLKPDILTILGDRFEAFAAASAAMICRVPIAHLQGGEATHGLIDEPIRHSISKMSHLHFASTEEYRRRIIQLGESPDRVFNVGALGVENIHKMAFLTKKEFEKEIGFSLGKQCILVTFHPVTLEKATAGAQFQNLLEAIDTFDNLKVIFTTANADTEGRIINRMIEEYVKLNKHKSISFISMGQLLYLSAMKHVNAVVGNSSSGIIEAPSIKTPTVNIGDRQKGRVRAESVIDCQPAKTDIINALEKSLSSEFVDKAFKMPNPYEKKNVAKRVKEAIKKADLSGILKKEFYDIPV